MRCEEEVDVRTELADDRARLAALGEAAKTRIARLCNGPDLARDLADVWWRTAGLKTSTTCAA